MLKFAILSSNKNNSREYEDLINISLLKTKEAYKIYRLYNETEFDDFIKTSSDEVIYITDEIDNIESIFNKIRIDKKDIRSFIIAIDFNNKISSNIKSKYFVNNKILINKDSFSKDFSYILELLLSSYRGKEKILKLIYNNCIYRISYSDILYIEKERNSKKIEIVCKDSSRYRVSKPLSEINNMLDNRFYKIHRSATINLYNIKNIDFKNNLITFVNDIKLDLISRDKKHDLKTRYTEQEEKYTIEV